ncbi:hypothetical protein E3U43_001005 [Larimichthys crocea]|uniref:Uncharacterized protein n=1 Tax=Larimichthys crocea TaxID=215358 RepID=A0ACD3QA72_LARCR|nr:hypothetical protein E3U43_001005 [Larimichthys crocea]
MGETVTNTNLSTIWGNLWDLRFFQVPPLIYTDRLSHLKIQRALRSQKQYPEIDATFSSMTAKPPADPTMVFFTMDYGMGWKITMLVLSSLALVLGTVILILNVYSNRRKKVVCVLKSYSPRPEVSAPGSPVPSERAPLTEHAMRLPHSSPTLQRGEILIEWKDGTVTPLYEA